MSILPLHCALVTTFSLSSLGVLQSGIVDFPVLLEGCRQPDLLRGPVTLDAQRPARLYHDSIHEKKRSVYYGESLGFHRLSQDQNAYLIWLVGCMENVNLSVVQHVLFSDERQVHRSHTWHICFRMRTRCQRSHRSHGNKSYKKAA